MKKYIKYVVILIVLGIAFGFYLYNKPHKNIGRAKADFEMKASNLYQEFETDESAANEKFLDKVITVSGTIREVTKDEEGNTSLMLETESPLASVICQLDNLTDHDRTDFKAGEKVSFKGICTGLLMDVVMVRCVEVEN